MAFPTLNPTTFDELLQTAASIKTEQLKRKRRTFESWPAFLRSTLFHEPAVRHLRDLPFTARLAEAEKLKAAGNAQFKKGRFAAAHACYERALGVLRYVQNDDPSFYSEDRKDGKGYVDDDDVRIVDWIGPCGADANPDDVDAARIAALKFECALNLGQALFKEGDHTACVEACTYAIELQPRSAKALYRRAKARTASVSSGTTEIALAQRDLALCVEIEPANRAAREAYAQLRRDTKVQRASDRSTFRGFLKRGDIGVDAPPAPVALLAVRSGDEASVAASVAAGAGARCSDAATSSASAPTEALSEGTRRAVLEKYGVDLRDPTVMAAFVAKERSAREAEAAAAGFAADAAPRSARGVGWCSGPRCARFRRWKHFSTATGMIASAAFVAVRLGALRWAFNALLGAAQVHLGGASAGDAHDAL